MRKTFTLALSALIGNAFCQSSPQTFTVSGNYTFTVPASVATITVEVVGAGGSGGGNGGGGGGGGGYAKGIYTVTPGSTLAVKVGTGGGGASAGTSNVGTLISATGGANGTSVSNPTIGGGGAGGVGTGGTIANYTGGTGGGGYWTYFGGGGAGAAGSVSNGTNGGNTIAWTGMCQTPGGSAGTGGGAPAGNGGKGAGFTDVSCNVTDPSAGGANFGGGGGGGNGNGGGPGTGAGGYCQITFGGCSAPAAPANATAASGQSICATKTTTLMATGTGTLNWYSSPGSVTSLATGTAYTTPTLSAGTYTYYAASTNTCSEGPRTAITVTVNASPALSVNSGSVCSGQSFTFMPAGAVSYTYPAGSSVTTPSLGQGIPSVIAVYTITGTNAAGCTGAVTSSLTVYSLPSVAAVSNRTLLCMGISATLTASGASTYTWNTGPTGASIVVSPTINTTYTVNGTAASTGCKNMASITQSVTACTALEESPAAEAILNIYPNPSNGDFSIATDREMTLSVLNPLGQVVKTVSLNASNHYKASITNLERDVYDDLRRRTAAIRQKIVVSR